jgi:hypothetical protein
MRKLANFVPASLLSRARELETLRQAFESCVDHSIYRHCTPLYLANEILYIGCDSAIWAGRIRLLSRSLAPRLGSATGLTIRKIEPMIRPERAPLVPQRPVRRPRQVAPEVVRHLQSIARAIDDPGLEKALGRLADRLSDRSGQSD